MSFQRFLGLSLTDPVPDETRICRFRNMLAQAGLGERLFALLEEQLKAGSDRAAGLRSTPSPTSPGRAQPRPLGDWPPRGKDGHFGYKVHLGIGQGSGLIWRLALTAASVSESHLFEETVIGDEAAAFAYAAYTKNARKKALRGRGFRGIINRPWRYPLITEKQRGGINSFRGCAGP